jgi:hypothetical protein
MKKIFQMTEIVLRYLFSEVFVWIFGFFMFIAMMYIGYSEVSWLGKLGLFLGWLVVLYALCQFAKWLRYSRILATQQSKDSEQSTPVSMRVVKPEGSETK